MSDIWSTFTSPDFLKAFNIALLATAKVFAVGAAGYLAVDRKWIKSEGLSHLGQLIAFVTLPCQVFCRFAQSFDPQQNSNWWQLILMSMGVTCGGLLIGKILASRTKQQEAALLIGYQNAGFFVLPMLQALLPNPIYEKASVMLFIFIIPFNATLWPVGSWLLLHKSEFDWKSLVRPPTVAVMLSLFLFGPLHGWSHRFDSTPIWDILFGISSPGAVQLIGDLTVPLATIVLGGSIAATVRQSAGGLRGFGYKRAAAEVAFVKLIVVPIIGFTLLKLTGVLGTHDRILPLLLMLEFASPPAINIAVFCQQHNYHMKLIPAACLLSYILAMLTVPIWVALVT